MRIKRLRIRNFRSIDELHFDMDDLTVFCGPNSCGKSNIVQSIIFALKEDISKTEIYKNLPDSLRNSQGAPMLSIWIDITFIKCPHNLRQLAGQPKAKEVIYQFRAIRSGTITRKFGDTTLKIDEFNTLKRKFHLIYIPPIRDLNAGGIKPFQKLLSDTLIRAYGGSKLQEPTKKAKTIIKEYANRLLQKQYDLTNGILHASSLVVNTDKISLDNLYESVSLDVRYAGKPYPLDNLGTGHQSAVIIHLYRQLGEITDGHALFLFEEPDNHLHPTTIRAIGKDLQEISKTSQVIMTTHSPIMINFLEYRNIFSLYTDEDRITQKREINLDGFTDNNIRSMLIRYGIRGAEALLAKKIIVVEGKRDVVIISCLIEIFTDSLPDNLDIVVVAADGKRNIVQLSELLNSLGVDWIAIFDRDAVIRKSSIPHININTDDADIEDGKDAIQSILPLLDTSQKRGINAKKCLNAILNELENGRPTPDIYDGSDVADVVNNTGKLTRDEKDELQLKIISGAVTRQRELLHKTNICLWPGTIEETLLYASGSEDIAEDAMIEIGVITAPINGAHRTNYLLGLLKRIAEEPEKIKPVLQKLYDNIKFSRTEVKSTIDFIVEDTTE